MIPEKVQVSLKLGKRPKTNETFLYLIRFKKIGANEVKVVSLYPGRESFEEKDGGGFFIP